MIEHPSSDLPRIKSGVGHLLPQGEKKESANAAVMAEALTWLGTPYRHQGTRKGVGCDCLGLVRGVWRAVYGCEPEAAGPYSPDWAEAGGEERLLEAARRHCAEKPAAEMAAGDLLLFRWRRGLPAKHCGILMGPDRFIHAYQGHAVLISALAPSWRRRVAGVFAWPLADIRQGYAAPHLPAGIFSP